MTQTETFEKGNNKRKKVKEGEIFPVMVTTLNKMCEM
jgi:Ethanolamine utilization protein EutJ (predicted chaperonin)